MYDFGQWEEAGVARNYIATKKTCKLREAKNFVVKPHSEPPHHCAIPVSPLFTTLTIIYVIIIRGIGLRHNFRGQSYSQCLKTQFLSVCR